jgi:hypothetical protein
MRIIQSKRIKGFETEGNFSQDTMLKAVELLDSTTLQSRG